MRSHGFAGCRNRYGTAAYSLRCRFAGRKSATTLSTGNAEFGLSLMDVRYIGGDQKIFDRLREKSVGKMMQERDGKAIAAELEKLTRDRHAKYGDTLFHLEPNIKDCPADCATRMSASGSAACAAKGPFSHRSFTRRWHSWLRCDVSCTIATSAMTTSWTGRRRTPRRNWESGSAEGFGRAWILLTGCVCTSATPASLSAGSFARPRTLRLRIEAETPLRRIRCRATPEFEIKSGRIELAPLRAERR